MSWYRDKVEEVVRKSGSDPEVGLSHKEAKKRLNQFGPNKLEEGKKTPAFLYLLVSLKILWSLFY